MRIPDRVPAPLARWLRTTFGKHLSRFAGVALVSLATTQVVLTVAYLIIGTGGVATLLGWLAGATVSYVLSRRAWERRGKPDLLKETLPFWIISIATGVVLTTAGHLAGVFAKDQHLAKLEATAVVAGTVLAANALTFITRFVIFHYLLFADQRGAVEPGRTRAGGIDAESLSPAAVRNPASDQRRDSGP